MAVRAVTPSNDVYCSNCSAKTDLEDLRCPGCGELFTGTVDAGLCGSCSTVVAIDADKCEKCGARFTPIRTTRSLSEDEFLRRMLKWRGLSAQDILREVKDGQNPNPAPASTMSPEESPPSPPDTNTILWQLFEPLEKVLRFRKNRLEQVDALIVEANKRIESLENSKDPDLQRERWRLKAWVDEITAERNDLSTIEDSMMDMERTYRNIISMQQAELHTKEESIRSRLKSFRSEIERIEKEKVSIREKEQEISRKEEELRKILAKISEKEGELAELEKKLSVKAREAEEQTNRLDEMRKQMEKENWLAAQRKIQSDMLAMKSESLATKTEKREIAATNSRMSELEERIGKINVERERLVKENEETKTFLTDLSRILKTLDDLLGQLPPEIIRKFANGEEFQLYERVLQKCGV